MGGTLGTPEVVQRLGICEPWTRELARRGDLPAIRIGQRGRYRFPTAVIEELARRLAASEDSAGAAGGDEQEGGGVRKG